MQTSPIAPPGSYRVYTAAHQYSDLGAFSHANLLAGLEADALYIGPGNSLVRVSACLPVLSVLHVDDRD
jgi:hypothetical protein